MTLSRAGVLTGAVVFLLFCVGFGWGPASTIAPSQQIGLLGLAAAGLVWPVVVLGLIGRARRSESPGS